MRVTPERIARLVGLGLTESQARAYLALLDLGPASVGEVARATATPRTWLYQVFGDLHRLGLADPVGGEPLRYQARSVEALARRMLGSLDARRAALSSEIPDLLREFSLPAGEAPSGGTSVFHGRQNAMVRVGEALHGARDRVLVAATRGTFARFAAAGYEPEMERLAEQGVRLEVLLPPDVAPPGWLRAFGEGIAARRGGAEAGVEVLLVDGRRAVAWVPSPDDGSVARGDDEGVASASPALCALWSLGIRGLMAGRDLRVAHP